MRSMISAAVLAALAIGGAGAAHAQYAAARTAYTVEPYTPASSVTIQGNGVRLRAEPFTLDTPVLSHGSTGLPLTVVGIARMPEWNWYQVILKSGQKAFIRSDYTSAPLKNAAAAPMPVPQAPVTQAPPTQMAAPLPPPNRIDYGAAPAPTPAFNPPTSVSAPVSLTPSPVAPAPVAAPAPARTYGPAPMSPAPIPAAPTPPSLGAPISLVPTSPMPGSAPASSNSGGLSSVDPNAPR